MSNMFCFQCQQTAKGTGCTVKGVCGKNDDTANFQDKLTGKLIALAKASKGKSTKNTDKLIIDGLFTTITNVNFNNDTINKLCDSIDKERALFESAEEMDMNEIWNDNEDIRSLKSLILFGIRGMAAYAHHAYILGETNDEVNSFFYTALSAMAEDLSADELLALTMETGNVNLKCMELLDSANTTAYGTPVPTKVSCNIESGPFIVVSGHDLHDLKLLLEQTKDKG
ncbi:MAG: hydroxylamine reductase, partial [Oscillospiraceae bacterium]